MTADHAMAILPGVKKLAKRTPPSCGATLARRELSKVRRAKLRAKREADMVTDIVVLELCAW
jgi:hypothetical protein